MMPGVNYVIYGSSSARTTPGVSIYRSLTLEENLNLPIKSHPSLRYLFFWCNFSVKLSWLQKRGNKLNTTLLIDIIHKTVKPSHLEK